MTRVEQQLTARVLVEALESRLTLELADRMVRSPAFDRVLAHVASSPELRVCVVQVLERLRAFAGDDTVVQRILDALEGGATTREDVLALINMKPGDYHKGRMRLTDLVQQLPNSLRNGLVG